MKASISINGDLWKRFRVVALEQGLTASRLLTGVVEHYLAGKASVVIPPKGRRGFMVGVREALTARQEAGKAYRRGKEGGK